MSETKRVRVRFAPSPTGPLHIGGVRTALYNYLFAKKNNGDFILRIEDTDTQRFVPGAEEYIIDALNWLGIPFDEGVGRGGKHAPYRQSERRNIYQIYVEQLLADGKAYMAFDTPEELEKIRGEISNFQYDASTRLQLKNSLTLSATEVQDRISKGENYVVRFLIQPNETVLVNDIIRGEVRVNSSVLDDKVLYKSADQLPTYHLANIVDDHLMEISHVIRGEEWLPSAPLHVLLYQAFGWTDSMPAFAHLPLLLKPDGNGKLSKRDGDRLGFPVFPCEWTDPKTGDLSSGYRESGYFPEAVVNFLALLGWNPGTEQELMSLEELTELFTLERCSKSGAKFDFEKGKWFNTQYLHKKSNEELAILFDEILSTKGVCSTSENDEPNFNETFFSQNYVAKAIGYIKERASFVSELWEQSFFFFKRPTTYAEKNVQKFWKPDTSALMNELIELLESVLEFTPEVMEPIVLDWINKKEYKMGAVMNAFRLSLVGESKGPHLFDIAGMIGKKETLLRLRQAVEILK
ncbi:MAG TPA: glutamate--tRNA ligase [Bacteroidales bacterium]|nr:glutamate--tRNA ligase [Bacteroidales bacterium]